MRLIKLLTKYLEYLGLFNFFSYLFQRFILKRKIIRFKVPGLKSEIAIRNYTSDIPLFASIFIRREYEVAFENYAETVIDCGANVGLASLYFLSKFPNAKIIAVEPEKNNFSLLVENMRDYKNVTCLNKGIWDKNGILEIIDSGGGNHAFKVKETIARSENSIDAISVEEILESFQIKKIDILKIDIEGSEEQVFLYEPVWIKKVCMIFCEIHESMKLGLTDHITSTLAEDFDISIHGEYHVFKRKCNVSLFENP